MADLSTPAHPEAPGGSPALPASPPPAPAPLALRFTGQGGEYFRIWIVNLLLTLATLGVYSAWAKVRRTRWFWSNTQLGGAAFDYHGAPLAILRGRILAGALFVAYSLAGRISVRAGAAVGAALLLLGPWLLHKSLRFKLSNTSWRGLRFGFEGTAGAAYAALAPLVILGALALVDVATLEPGAIPKGVLLVEAVLFALWPWLHARLKAYQHRGARYGGLAFDFEPSTGAFYGLYGKALLAGAPCFAVLVGGFVAAYQLFAVKRLDPGVGPAMAAGVLAAYVLVLLAYLAVGAFFSARLQRLVWSRTRAGSGRFSTTVTARGLVRVWLANGLLTLVTLGVYWPWAAVAIARYRLESMVVEPGAPLDAVAAGDLAGERSTTGDAAVDFFGWDIGL